jgi:hypothetical protein
VPTVPVDAGVTVDLPAEWIPLPAVEAALTRAWRDFTIATTLPGEKPRLWLDHWPNVLFLRWSEDRIELTARNRPSITAPLTLIDFQFAERDWQRFKVDARYAELYHEPSGTRFYDVHLRVKPVAGEPKPSPTKPRAKRLTKAAERVSFIYGFCVRSGAEQSLNHKELFAALRRVYGEGHRLLQIEDRAQRDCWEKVRGLDPWSAVQNAAHDAVQDIDDK